MFRPQSYIGFVAGRLVLVLATIVFHTTPAAAQATTVFKGLPSVRIIESGTGALPETLSREKAGNLECVISKIGEDYYWASRENKRMVRVEGPTFITFVAVEGQGYVKIIKPDMKDAAALLGEAEQKFDYVEHLLTGLQSITYYGTKR
jgi:hypothetical protein